MLLWGLWLAVVSSYHIVRLLWVLGLGVPLSRWLRIFLPYLSFALGVGFGRSAFAVVSYFPVLSFVRAWYWVWPFRFRGGFVYPLALR